MTLRVLDLFSGIGGFSLGLERTGGFETAAFCEYEAFPRAVLAKHWPNVPCFPDVRELKGSDIDGPIDLICGGYPCQPFSAAGKRKGTADDRHLWPEFNRLVDELRPTWVIGENVAGHLSMGLDDVLSDLERQGYAARTFVIPACAVDAPHRRDRVWTIAQSQAGAFQNASCDGWEQSPDGEPIKADREWASKRQQKRSVGGAYSQQAAQATANANNTRPQGRLSDKKPHSEGWQEPSDGRPAQRSYWRDWGRACVWKPEPDVGRVANGVPRRVDRLKALGNAVVPQVVEMIGYAILEAHYDA